MGKIRLDYVNPAIALALIAAISLGGCLVVPYPMPSKTAAVYIERQETEFIKPGSTTQAEIKERLGHPSMTVSAPERWVYRLRQYYSNRWGMCVFVGGGYAGSMDCEEMSEEKIKTDYLYLHFDSSGKVSKISTPSVYALECIESGVCPASVESGSSRVYDGLVR